METLLIILTVIAVLSLIAITYIVGKFAGAGKLKETLNKMTVREMLAHKRDYFNSL